MSRNQKDPFHLCGRDPAASLMTANGLSVVVHLPDAPVSIGYGDEEVAQHLPPYAPRPAFLVEDLKEQLPHWKKSSPEEGVHSFVVPVMPEYGLWLDFNRNRHHTHHVAVLISIQGVNTITGRKSDNFVLEQYRKRCPVHDLPLTCDGYCEGCKYKAPPQNYLASSATPNGLFWLDGWRAPDGSVREWVFTENAELGVAKRILGELRTYSLGIAFVLSREPKPQPARQSWRDDWDDILIGSACLGSDDIIGSSIELLGDLDEADGASLGFNYGETKAMASFPHNGFKSEKPPQKLRVAKSSKVVALGSPDRECTIPDLPKLEIKPGAKIRQEIYPDLNDLSFWQDKPAAVFVINYEQSAIVAEILKSGLRGQKKEGFLDGFPVGHHK